MTKLNLIYTTFASMDQAQEMARILLDEKLIACANIHAPMTSLYKWKGKMEQEPEVPVIFKTTDKKVTTATKVIEKNHPYETSCIVVINTENTNEEFLNWVKGSVTD